MIRYAFSSIGVLAALLISLTFVYRQEKLSRPSVQEPLSIPEEPHSPDLDAVASGVATSTPPQEKEPQGKKTAAAKPPEMKQEEIRLPALPLARIELPPLPAATSTLAPAPVAEETPAAPQPDVSPSLPPLDERALLLAVVKIECPSEDRRGKYVGSGFVLPKGIVVTAAHVIKDSGSDDCQVIFPNKDRAPSHYLHGVTEDREGVRRRHDEEGIDVAVLFLPALAAYPEGRAVFPDGYPYIPYPICGEPRMLKDKLMHFGYPSNYLDQSYLSKSDGEAVVYADIQGIKEQLSEDQTFAFKTPIFSYTNDQSQLHPYMVSRVPSFYGDSGGLAFNATKQCILGPHRGGTIGGGAGENFSVFPVLGWGVALKIIPR